MTKEVGPCRGAFQRYFYNNDSGKCEEFLYGKLFKLFFRNVLYYILFLIKKGGCEGNENNFETVEECNKKCSASIESVSVVPGNLKFNL